MNNGTAAGRFAALVEYVRSGPPVPAAVVDAHDEHVLAAALEARDAGLLDPLLVGPRAPVEALCERRGVAVPPLVESAPGKPAAETAVQLVEEGRVALLVKGWVHTDVLMHPVLAHLRTARRVSHVFVAGLATYHKLLLITDAVINIMPDLMTKAEIIRNAVDLAGLLGIALPKVAALSTVEVVKPTIPSTIDAACLSKMAQRGQIGGAVVDGPLAFDNAISREAARIKGIESEVCGDVDILLAPDLVAGNILVKDLEYLAGATLAGVVVGARVPIILTSRSDPQAARLASAALAVRMYREWSGGAPPVERV
ncbi:MAG: phosphate acetyl/butaryl transferase [Chromatiales bacterium 21-64-14]|nr:MAG: phosphate acetyl/butaryl transferase [Chromatiales bacterium 21-64-14]